MRYTKYKKYYKISCFGNNDLWINREQIHNLEHQVAILQMVKHVDLILMVCLMM